MHFFVFFCFVCVFRHFSQPRLFSIEFSMAVLATFYEISFLPNLCKITKTHMQYAFIFLPSFISAVDSFILYGYPTCISTESQNIFYYILHFRRCRRRRRRRRIHRVENHESRCLTPNATILTTHFFPHNCIYINRYFNENSEKAKKKKVFFFRFLFLFGRFTALATLAQQSKCTIGSEGGERASSLVNLSQMCIL